jgi:ADP-ribosyl-[dinitrogen reductase] hydrolase
MMGLIDPLAAMKHRWAPVIEGADLITRLVRDYLRLEHEHDGAINWPRPTRHGEQPIDYLR